MMGKAILSLVAFSMLGSACGRTDQASVAETATDAAAVPTVADERATVQPAIDLLGTRWQWVRTVTPVELIEAVEPERYTLLLNTGGQAELRLDCNNGRGSYEVLGHQLSFGPLAATRMACPPDSQDAVFTKQLGQVTTYFVNDGVLYLEMPMDSGTMRFEPAATE